MNILLIMFITMAIVSALGVSMLYLSKNPKIKNALFYFLSVWALFITVINITGLPTNFIVDKLIALLFGCLSVVSVIIKIKQPDKLSLSYLLVSVSVLLGLLDLFLF